MLDIVNPASATHQVIKYTIKLNEPLGKDPIYRWLTEKIEVMIFRDGDRVRVVSSLCPHMGARLSWDKTKTRVTCPWHGLSYDGNGLKSCHHRYRKLNEFRAEVFGDEIVIYE